MSLCQQPSSATLPTETQVSRRLGAPEPVPWSQSPRLTSQRNMNMPMWSCSRRVTLSARRSVLPSGSKSNSRLRAPFLSWVHTSISSWQYANVQFSPYWHSCRSCTSAWGGGRRSAVGEREGENVRLKDGGKTVGKLCWVGDKGYWLVIVMSVFVRGSVGASCRIALLL